MDRGKAAGVECLKRCDVERAQPALTAVIAADRRSTYPSLFSL